MPNVEQDPLRGSARLATSFLLASCFPISAHATFSDKQSFSMVCERVGEQRIESIWKNGFINSHDRSDWPGSWATGLLQWEVGGDDLFAPMPRLRIQSAPSFETVLETIPLTSAIVDTDKLGSITFAANRQNLQLDRHEDMTWRGGWTTVAQLTNGQGPGQTVTYTALVCHEDAEGRGGAR